MLKSALLKNFLRGILNILFYFKMLVYCAINFSLVKSGINYKVLPGWAFVEIKGKNKFSSDSTQWTRGAGSTMICME